VPFPAHAFAFGGETRIGTITETAITIAIT
jgi:hypothetical protein